MASGGKRAEAGRKPCLDKKQTVVLYIETSVINAFGGLSATKQQKVKLIYYGNNGIQQRRIFNP
jgi:hypothetical protein